MRKIQDTTITIALSFITHAIAQTPTPGLDADAINREQQRLERRLDERKQQFPSKPIEKETDTEVELAEQGPEFVLQQIQFTASNYLSREQLTEIVQPYLGTVVDFSDLQNIIASINALYQQLGIYTAVAILPQQAIDNGSVVIRLVEGKLGALTFEGNTYMQDNDLRQWFRQQDNTDLIDIKALEQDVLKYNRVHDALLEAQLRAGQEFGLTDIVVRVNELPRNRWTIFLDNYGYSTSGQYELGMLYQRQQNWLPSDRTLVYALATEGTYSVSASYNAPIRQSGWRLGASLSATRTEIIEGDFADLDVMSESNYFSIETSWLSLSRTYYWLNIIGSLSSTKSETEIRNAPLSNFRINRANIGAEFNWLNAQWQFSVRQLFTQAHLDDKLLDHDETIPISKSTLIGLYRPQKMPFYGLLQAEMQLSPQEALPGSLAFAIGGPTTVRGYEPGFVSGDEGHYFQLELHYTGIQWKQLIADTFVFYDKGRATSLNPSTTLSSVGIGLNMNISQSWSINTTLAKAKQDVLPEQDDWLAYARISCHCW